MSKVSTIPNLTLIALFILASQLFAASILPQPLREQVESADAVAVAILDRAETERMEDQIVTRFYFSNVESLRGNFPSYFSVIAPGGNLESEGRADSRLPALEFNVPYLLFLSADGQNLRFRDGPAGALPVTESALVSARIIAMSLPKGPDLYDFAAEPLIGILDVTQSGLLDSNGFRRFTLPDRGEPIPVVIDDSTLPSGISSEEATTALQNALDAWEAVSSLRFTISGRETFSQSATDFSSEDGLVIRVQMHDNFNDIPDTSTTVGFGGAGFSVAPGYGATIDGKAFNPVTHGYVVMDHTKSLLSDPIALEEVLAHEIGHVVGLAHSSESDGETDPLLSDALMYYQVHDDNRGADPRVWDIDTVVQAHPANTPPYSYDREMIAITWPSFATPAAGVNTIRIPRGDLQNDPLTLSLVYEEGLNGSFTFDGSRITYLPAGHFSDGDAIGFYDLATVELSDGENQSLVDVLVVGFRSDTFPSGNPDGIPDSWVSNYFGSPGAAMASQDPDGDNFDNGTEFLLGTDPTDPSSRFAIVQTSSGTIEFTTQLRDVYSIESSSNLVLWSRERLIQQNEASGTMVIESLPEATVGNPVFLRVNRLD